MQAYSDNQADVNGNGFHLLLYISYLAIKRAREERNGKVREEGGGLWISAACAPPPSYRLPLTSHLLSESPLSLIPPSFKLISHPSSAPHLARAH